MKKAKGNIWDWYSDGYKVVIPTNIGWNKNGENIMGRGLAAQAKNRFPHLPLEYGRYCQKRGKNTPVVEVPGLDLIMFPTKPLNEDKPWYIWRSGSTKALVERSTQQLAQLPGNIALPLVGRGNGGLRKDDVLKILERFLKEDRFVLVEV